MKSVSRIRLFRLTVERQLFKQIVLLENDMETKRLVEKDAKLNRNDLIVITGAGGFIAGNLVKYFTEKGFTRIRAVDKKPLYEWYLRTPGVE